jgi:hypothetical protein
MTDSPTRACPPSRSDGAGADDQPTPPSGDRKTNNHNPFSELNSIRPLNVGPPGPTAASRSASGRSRTPTPRWRSPIQRRRKQNQGQQTDPAPLTGPLLQEWSAPPAHSGTVAGSGRRRAPHRASPTATTEATATAIASQPGAIDPATPGSRRTAASRTAPPPLPAGSSPSTREKAGPRSSGATASAWLLRVSGGGQESRLRTPSPSP